MYQFETRVRFSECDCNRKATITSVLNYLQDCSSFQSEDLGIGVEYLWEHQEAWLLSSWQIDLIRRPKLGEHITSITRPYKFKGSMGYRNFLLMGEGEECLLKADSIWVYVNMEAQRPMRIPDIMIERYGMNPPIEMEYLGRKLPHIENGMQMPPITILKEHLDTNFHVNNAKYIQMAEDLCTDEREIKRIRAEYQKAALLGDVIIPYVAEEENQRMIKLADKDGNSYANVIFQYQHIEQ